MDNTLPFQIFRAIIPTLYHKSNRQKTPGKTNSGIILKNKTTVQLITQSSYDRRQKQSIIPLELVKDSKRIETRRDPKTYEQNKLEKTEKEKNNNNSDRAKCSNLDNLFDETQLTSDITSKVWIKQAEQLRNMKL